MALGLDPELTHYLAVGSHFGDTPDTAQKGHDLLIRSWRGADLGRHGGRLHLLGDGPLRPRLEAVAGGDPSIVLPGIRRDVHDWYTAGDTYVMPSRWEGLPLAGIEALGTGIRAIFSDGCTPDRFPTRALRQRAARSRSRAPSPPGR
jgi:glycosyltransferase involved in cell wall biosynthesis